MPVGTLVTGHVLEKGSRKPVAGASLIYMIRRENTKTLDRMSAVRIYWANEYHRRYTADDGTFEQPVASGEKGYLMVKAPQGNYVGRFTTNGEMQFDKPGGTWYLVEGFAKIEPGRGTSRLALDILVTPGRTVKGTVTGPQGQKIQRGVVIRMMPRHTQDNQAMENVLWGEPILKGKFSVPGCDPQNKTVLYFLDAQHQWGDTVRWDPRTQAKSPLTVALKPCGSARVRVVDEHKKPLANNAMMGIPRLELVLVFREAPPDSNYTSQWHHLQAPTYFLDYARRSTLQTNEDGVITYPTLIPGAPYRLLVNDGRLRKQKDPSMTEIALRVEPGKTVNLGEIVMKGP